MRNLLLLAVVAVLCLTGCSGTPDDANANANVEPAPMAADQYTDAASALADGIKLLDRGNTTHAIDLLNRAVELDPDLADGYFQLGIAYSLIEFRDQTQPVDIPGDQPDGDEPEKSESEKTNSTKSFEKAVDAYKKRIESDKEDHVAYYNLGRSYNKLNKDNEAASALRQAVRLKPEDIEYQMELGSILIKLAKYGEAVGALRKAVDLDPENVEALDLLEKAEAGLKRINFTTLPKDANSNKEDSNSSEEGTGATPGTPPSNTRPPGPPPPPRATPPATKTP
ncbi:MAG: tetratricopeptide repeat protein [Acidobacteria bacterium]|nr:tetratricopeptide repeat protein [Acidobacteriota bacterium]